jgi:hypothetical protein
MEKRVSAVAMVFEEELYRVLWMANRAANGGCLST